MLMPAGSTYAQRTQRDCEQPVCSLHLSLGQRLVIRVAEDEEAAVLDENLLGLPSTSDDHATTNDGEIAVRDAIVTAQALEFCAHYFFSLVIDRQGPLEEAEPPLIVEEDEPVILVEVGEELLNGLAVAQGTFEMFRPRDEMAHRAQRRTAVIASGEAGLAAAAPAG